MRRALPPPGFQPDSANRRREAEAEAKPSALTSLPLVSGFKKRDAPVETVTSTTWITTSDCAAPTPTPTTTSEAAQPTTSETEEDCEEETETETTATSTTSGMLAESTASEAPAPETSTGLVDTPTSTGSDYAGDAPTEVVQDDYGRKRRKRWAGQRDSL